MFNHWASHTQQAQLPTATWVVAALVGQCMVEHCWIHTVPSCIDSGINWKHFSRRLVVFIYILTLSSAIIATMSQWTFLILKTPIGIFVSTAVGSTIVLVFRPRPSGDVQFFRLEIITILSFKDPVWCDFLWAVFFTFWQEKTSPNWYLLCPWVNLHCVIF